MQVQKQGGLSFLSKGGGKRQGGMVFEGELIDNHRLTKTRLKKTKTDPNEDIQGVSVKKLL